MSTRKKKLFTAGTAALSRIARPPISGYICPLCLRIFDAPDALTKEHAPQLALGGKSICLTCKPCNNTAGHSIDSAVSREQAYNKLLAKDGTPTRITLSHDDIALNSEISQKNDVIEIRILPGQNNPRSEERLRSIFQAGDTDGLKLDISAYGGFRRRDAHIGYLKSAYLGAFAKFGYSWIFGVDTAPIRSQIIDPSSEVLPNCRIAFSQVESDFAQRGFYFMEQPLVAILASIPPYGILLPWPGGPSAIEISRWIVAERAKSTSGQFNFTRFAPWPRTSEFLFDRRQET